MAAAITPRVWAILVADEVLPSEIEPEVFSLEGLRKELRAESFPHSATLSVLLVLSSARKGSFEGKVQIIDDDEDRCVRYKKIIAEFGHENDIIFLPIEAGPCTFPAPGRHWVKVTFTAPGGTEVLKGEFPIQVLGPEE